MDRLISSAASSGVYQILKLTVLSSLLAAVTLPVTVMSAASLLDNPWERVGKRFMSFLAFIECHICQPILVSLHEKSSSSRRRAGDPSFPASARQSPCESDRLLNRQSGGLALLEISRRKRARSIWHHIERCHFWSASNDRCSRMGKSPPGCLRQGKFYHLLTSSFTCR